MDRLPARPQNRLELRLDECLQAIGPQGDVILGDVAEGVITSPSALMFNVWPSPAMKSGW